MFKHGMVFHKAYGSPIPMWPTPWYLHFWAKWRYQFDDEWIYVTNKEYKLMFGIKP